MGRKKSSSKKVVSNDFQDFSEDDEIDAFHKQRDVVPIDINDDVAESDEEEPVFGFQDDDGSEDDEDEEDIEDTGLAARIKREQSKLRSKLGGVEDEMDDDPKEVEEASAVWGRRKDNYHGGDNVDYEIQSSDEDLPAEEEAEVLRLQKEKAKTLSMADFGLEDDSEDDSDAEPTFEDILVKGKTSKPSTEKGPQDETGTTFEKVSKDLNALTTEEQMDVVYSAAPELVGLLTELNDASKQLENIINPLLTKARKGKFAKKGGLKYLELKQVLLLSYCQAITFYLLLKSEGQPVRDHPVIERLVEIKSLLEKMKKLDENLPAELEDILDRKFDTETEPLLARQDAEKSDLPEECKAPLVPAEVEVPHGATKLVKESGSALAKSKHQSVEMLKVRAALEEKLKQKGVFSSVVPKHESGKRNAQPLNGQLMTLDDFDDCPSDVRGRDKGNGHAQLSNSATLSKIATRVKKAKLISGDDDLPKRDDIGERRRNHELRVLAGAGIKSNDDSDDEPNTQDVDGSADMEVDNATESESESDLEFYKQVEAQHKAKLASKSEKYSRTPAEPLLPEILEDGKRHISQQMEKNRGLTRARKKLTKNPRKKYKLKHKDAVKRRKGQVREIKKPSGTYGGETSGINAGVSRSIRFKN
ncbi:protein THALLO isoform X2 [Apium graveolens]|uniref:protein THALLO isoform X2 n=1 Tax=Apium graveolens TaxID=4045 RepID=UPI003D78F12A